MWKKQQQDQGLLLESQDISERQPLFLKDRADAFLKAGNVPAALNAYSRAIELERANPHPDGPLVKLHANRAAARLRAFDFRGAAEDASEALEGLGKRELGEGLAAAGEGGIEAEAAEIRDMRFRHASCPESAPLSSS